MAFTDGKPAWQVIHIAATAMMLVLAAGSFAIGEWFSGGVMAFAGLLLLLARLRLFRVAVTREPEAILCRYIPWYEPGPYGGIGFTLGLGAIGVAAAFQSDFGPMIGVVGAALLLMLPVVAAKYWRGDRRCRLRITATALTVPDPARGYAELTIPRQSVLAIGPRTQTVGFGSTELVLTEITFRETGATQTVCVGPGPTDDTVWLTVRPASLLTALQQWVSADPADPALLDRLDAQLRSGTGCPDPRILAAAPAVGPPHPAATGSPTAPGSPAAAAPQTPAAPPTRRARKVSGGPLWLLLVVSALGAGFPLFRHLQPDPAPERTVSSAAPTVEQPACPVPGASTVVLTKKSAAEPTIEIPLTPGWVTPDITDPALASDTALRGYADNPAITKDSFPFLKVTLQKATNTGAATAEELIGKARKVFPTVTQSSATVCGNTVYRFDTAGYNPDDKGEQTGTTVFTIIDSTDGTRWMAAASLKTRNPDQPAYIAQRDALAAGFHAGFS